VVTNAVEERLVVVRIRSFFERFEIVEGVFDLADRCTDGCATQPLLLSSP